jgi:tripartite-type tricarboxylate transporter receptor subunit TctC
MNLINRRNFIAGAGAVTVAPRAVWAQTFPNKPLRLIVPFAAGGAADIIGRTVADGMGPLIGQQVVVENKPGAGSNLGLDTMVKSEPDGYTFALASIAVAVNQFLYKSMPYDAVKDLAPLTLALETPNVVIVPKDSPIKSIADLIAAAKTKNGGLSYASAGVGSSLHLAAELFMQKSGISLAHIPYKGSNPALTDLIAGRVDVMFDNLSTALPQVEGNTVRAIAVTTAKRVASLPNVPTIAEAGVPGYEMANWWAFFAPARTPAPATAFLSENIRNVVNGDAAKKRFADIGGTVVASTQESLSQHLAAEVAKWGKTIKTTGLTPT